MLFPPGRKFHRHWSLCIESVNFQSLSIILSPTTTISSSQKLLTTFSFSYVIYTVESRLIDPYQWYFFVTGKIANWFFQEYFFIFLLRGFVRWLTRFVLLVTNWYAHGDIVSRVILLLILKAVEIATMIKKGLSSSDPEAYTCAVNHAFFQRHFWRWLPFYINLPLKNSVRFSAAGY